MDKVVGIDLGTTNSVIAITEGSKPTVIPNSDNLRTTPSIIAYTKKQQLLVGQTAKRQAIINPENTFYSVKRLIGSKSYELNMELIDVPYKIIYDSKDNIKLECPALNKQFSPEEISAQVLRKLIEDANKYTGQEITEAVITVPAYFNASQRQATQDAGQIAGLNVRRILNEPTAASLAYGLDQNKNEVVLVFDLGGGTFDVSLLEVGDGVFEVLATSGDTELGGDNFDTAIVEYLANNFETKEKIDLRKNPQALQRLKEAAEKAKVELSTITETIINLPFITAIGGEPKHIEINLTRDKFEELCDALIQKCRIPVEEAIRDAQITAKDINQVVLVGGSTRIPAVRNSIQKFINKKPNQTVNPDEVVAIGAALQGGVLAGEVKNILLIDVTPLSLGVETFGGITTKIIPKNTTIPIKKSEIFSTAADDQTSVEVHILQGERELANDNKSLGRFTLDDIPKARRSVPQIEVTFEINVNGILSVKATDKTTGQQQSIVVAGASTLEQSEIDAMIKNAEKFAVIDKEKVGKIKLINATKAMIDEANTILLDNSETINSPLLEKTKKLIEELKINVKNEDYTSMKLNLPKLEKLLTKIKNISLL
jgi:molecular chaperone DnaK